MNLDCFCLQIYCGRKHGFRLILSNFSQVFIFKQKFTFHGGNRKCCIDEKFNVEKMNHFHRARSSEHYLKKLNHGAEPVTTQTTNLDLRLMMALIETALPQVEIKVRTMQTRARRISTEGTACWFHIMVAGGSGVTRSRDILSRSRDMFPDELLRMLPDISSVFLSMCEGTYRDKDRS